MLRGGKVARSSASSLRSVTFKGKLLNVKRTPEKKKKETAVSVAANSWVREKGSNHRLLPATEKKKKKKKTGTRNRYRKAENPRRNQKKKARRNTNIRQSADVTGEVSTVTLMIPKRGEGRGQPGKCCLGRPSQDRRSASRRVGPTCREKKRNLGCVKTKSPMRI